MIINQTERAIVECVRERTREELAKRVPSIDNINNRRLIYLLIEDRMAMYEEARHGRKATPAWLFRRRR
jgi:transcription initiation factor IIE alpha subunit